MLSRGADPRAAVGAAERFAARGPLLGALAMALALTSTACAGRTPSVPGPTTPQVSSTGSAGGCVAGAGQLLVREGTPYPLSNGDSSYRVGLAGQLSGEPPRVRLAFSGTTLAQAASEDVAAGDTVSYLGFTIAVVEVCPSAVVLTVSGSAT